MIVRLTGTLVDKQPPLLVLDVGGVGYEVEAPLSVFAGLPGNGEQVSLMTHLVVREDAHTLYGFANAGDRTLFRELLKVSGVGPRLALTILSGVSADEFRLMVEAGDTLALTRLPGIGKKTAERLLVEMRGRLDSVPASDTAPGAAAAGNSGAEARAALTALGYSASEALKMVRAVDGGGDMNVETLVRSALRQKMERK